MGIASEQVLIDHAEKLMDRYKSTQEPYLLSLAESSLRTAERSRGADITDQMRRLKNLKTYRG